MNNATEKCSLQGQDREQSIGKRLRNLFPASILNYLIALAAIFSLNFILPRLMPGDPLQAIYGQEALVAMTPEMEAELIRQFSLDKSWWDQLLAYVLGLLQGDLGFSYYYREQVSQVIMGALPWTLLLTGLALIIATAIGLILGIESGFKRGSSSGPRPGGRPHVLGRLSRFLHRHPAASHLCREPGCFAPLRSDISLRRS